MYREDWLIDYLLFYVPLKNISLIWRRHHYRWRAAKFRPMLGAHGSPFSSLLRYIRGCGGTILTRILTGMYLEEEIVEGVTGRHGMLTPLHMIPTPVNIYAYLHISFMCIFIGISRLITFQCLPFIHIHS
jgi:hypothetical protein